jgi:hypothetical protein
MKQHTKTEELHYKMENISFSIQTSLIMTNLTNYILHIVKELCRPHKIEFHIQGDGGGAMFWSYRVSKGFGYDTNITNGSIDLVI